MTEAAFQVLLSYLLGAVSGSLVLGRLRRVDIRTMGSGNAGGTNALRTQGVAFALGVVIIDIGKGAVAATWIAGLALDASAAGDPGTNLRLACGMAAVIGHCYPVWHGFRGGKGAATAVGVLAVVNPWLLLPLALSWVLTLVLSGYVGLATVVAGLSLVPAALWRAGPGEMFWFVTALALFMAFTHRRNFSNMAKGQEHRFERVRVFHRWRGGGD